MGIQFNSKSFATFREVMAKANDAMHGLNDQICTMQARVANLNGLIESNNALIERLEKGDNKGILKSLDALKNENVEYSAKLDVERDELAKAREVATERLNDAYALVDKFGLGTKASPNTLYDAYCDYIRNGATDVYAQAIADFFGNGVSANDCIQFVNVAGKRVLGAKASFKAQTLVDVMSYKPWRKLFIANLCDELVSIKAISAYKYNYVAPQKKSAQ